MVTDINIKLTGKKLAYVLFAGLALSACSTTPTVAPLPDDGLTAPADTVDQGIPEQQPNYVYDSDSRPQNITPSPDTQTHAKRPPSGTVVALLNQARAQQRSGKPERAAAVLERALRLDPKNAQLWNELAQIRLQQGQLSLAESLAAKSSSLANDDQALVRSNATIIEQVKILRGDGQ